MSNEHTTTEVPAHVATTADLYRTDPDLVERIAELEAKRDRERARARRIQALTEEAGR